MGKSKKYGIYYKREVVFLYYVYYLNSFVMLHNKSYKLRVRAT